MIAITLGDPAGIGPRVTRDALQQLGDRAQFSIIGPENHLAEFRAMGLECHSVSSFDGPLGEATAESGRCALEALEESVRLAKNNAIQAVVTAPISKLALHRAGSSFVGHTDFFAKRFAAETTMAFVSSRLNVALATTHVPLREAVERLTPDDIVAAGTRLHAFLRDSIGVASPRLALAGLNPHAGEAGLLGTDEIERIAPAAVALRERGVSITEPLPPDSVFARAIAGEFDGVVALYHDQGLIPVKLQPDSVHVTLGLPIVRTSVDHGTAFDRARGGEVDATPMLQALRLAHRLVR